MNSLDNVEKMRPFGRISRLLFGILVFLVVVPYYFLASTSVFLQTLFVIVGLAVFYIVLDIVINRYVSSINPIIGAIPANVPILLMWLLGRNGIQLGTPTYLGIAPIVTSLRADAGCEVMSIPGLIFKRYTHLACLFFPSIDWLERKMVKKA